MSDDNRALEGVCHFFSETGTEGGYWAFQDRRFIRKNEVEFTCTKCKRFRDVRTGFLERLDRMSPPRALWAIWCYIKSIRFECLFDRHDWQPCPEEYFSYDGLHYLRDGDELTIYAKEDGTTIVWSGTIALTQHPVFTEDAHGFWIHADQAGIDRKTWALYFFREYPARLVPAKRARK